jgi:hypothetical protein
MTSPFVEILTRYRSIEKAYNTCDIEQAETYRQQHSDVMDEIIATQPAVSSMADLVEALRQARAEMSDNDTDDDWDKTLAGCFVKAALAYAEGASE